MIALISERKTAVRAYCWCFYPTHFVSMWQIERDCVCFILISFSAIYRAACSFLHFCFDCLLDSILFFQQKLFLSLPVGLFSYLRDLSREIGLKSSWSQYNFCFSTKLIPPFTKHRETTTFRLMYFTHICLHRKTRCFTLKPAKTRCSFSLLQSSGFESGNLMCFMKTSTLTLV